MAASGPTSIWVLNGPNLNLLGTREPHIYGDTTLAAIEQALVEDGARAGVTVTCFQSNEEGALVTRVQQARGHCNGLIVNFGAYSHSSIALRDALTGSGVPTIEVHLSNVHAREPFRHQLMTAGACAGIIAGLGPIGYRLALSALFARLDVRAVPGSPDPDPFRDEHRP